MNDMTSGMLYRNSDGTWSPLILDSSVVPSDIKTKMDNLQTLVEEMHEVMIGLQTFAEE